MYGYIVTNTPELKIKEYDLYNSYYCGLCHTLKKDYGNIPRLTLSYDMTFLTILLSSLYEVEETVKEKKCILKLGTKKLVRENDIQHYVADMSILLSYLKCEDDWKDEKKFKARIMQLLLSGSMKKLRDKYPDKIDHIIKELDDLHKDEESNNTSFDHMASFFGKCFGEVFAYKEDIWKEYLYNIGYYLGEYIYLLDAYDDREADEKKHCYNPFSSIEDNDQYDHYIKDVLMTVISECTNNFEMLPIIKNIEILRNILYSGVWTKYEIHRKKRAGEEDGSL